MSQPDRRPDSGNEPVCAMCHPPRPEDIDPQTTVYRCPEHQRYYDREIAPMLWRMLQPAPPPSRPIIITGY